MYTPETIRNLIADGKLDAYIEMERKTVARFEAATEARQNEYPDGAKAADVVSLGHLYGSVGIDVDDSAYPHNAVASIAMSDWTRKFSVASFDGDQRRALSYARAALANELKRERDELLDKAQGRLAALEAAR